jgi:CHRD domain-containing protein
MKKLLALAVIGIATLSVASARSLAAPSSSTTNFAAHLSDKNEVPPVESGITGTAKFHLTDNNQVLAYTLTLHDTSGLFVAHIHSGPIGVNGPVAAFLLGPLPMPGLTQDTVRVEGFLTDANLVGPLAGKTIADLVTLIKSGGAYVNAHTFALPGGATRGQITVRVDD